MAALLFTLVLTHTGPAKPRPAPRPQPTDSGYEVLRDAIRPGTYATAINIHNPSLGGNPVTIYKRAVLAPPEGDDTQSPSKFLKYSLSPGHAVEVDCQDIELNLLQFGPVPFFKGFVTILSRDQLDVVGVYTAEPPAVTIPLPPSSTQSQIPGIALEMLPIAGRLEFVPGGSLGTDQGLGGRIYEYSAKFLCGIAHQPI